MNNDDYCVMSNVHQFRKKIDSYLKKRYNMAQSVLKNNGIDFDDFHSEIWFGISQCESGKSDAYYMQFVGWLCNHIIRDAGRSFVHSVSYDDQFDEDGYQIDDTEKTTYNPRNFVAVCQTLGGHIHIAASYATRKTACGQKWRYDVAAEVPDDIECPKCREAYFANVRLV